MRPDAQGVDVLARSPRIPGAGRVAAVHHREQGPHGLDDDVRGAGDQLDSEVEPRGGVGPLDRVQRKVGVEDQDRAGRDDVHVASRPSRGVLAHGPGPLTALPGVVGRPQDQSTWCVLDDASAAPCTGGYRAGGRSAHPESPYLEILVPECEPRSVGRNWPIVKGRQGSPVDGGVRLDNKR